MNQAEIVADAVTWRRHLHKYPELSFEETETAAFVEERLRSFGDLEVSRPTPTSVVARLVGKEGPALALRADMDALPITEETELEYASTRRGVMHACGHDVHTAVLLAVARSLVARRREIHGEVRFIFQHAEETPPGGAKELVAAGVLDGVDAILGAHVFSSVEVGKVAVPVGPFMAAPDTFRIDIRGAGGHAAMPHDVIDPVTAAAQVVVNLQHIVSREVDPISRAVLSVTQIVGGTAPNIVPDHVQLAGTVRTFEPSVRAQVRHALARIAADISRAHRCTAIIDYTEGYSPVVNDDALSQFVRDCVEPDRLIDIAPVMGGEDFSAYQEVVPGCFFIVGGGGLGSVPHHNSQFTLDEDAIFVAIDVFVRTASAFCQESFPLS